MKLETIEQYRELLAEAWREAQSSKELCRQAFRKLDDANFELEAHKYELKAYKYTYDILCAAYLHLHKRVLCRRSKLSRSEMP